MISKISFGNDDLLIQKGLSMSQVQELIAYARTDSMVRKFTSDSSRFKDITAYQNWLKKDRIIYSLVDKNDRLVGIIWFGKSLRTDRSSNVTFAVRLYPPVRGKGLAVVFIKTVFSLFLNSEEYEKLNANGIWLETSTDNIAAIKTYSKVGFKRVSGPNLSNKIIMEYQK